MLHNASLFLSFSLFQKATFVHRQKCLKRKIFRLRRARRPSCTINCIFNARRGIANFLLRTWLGCVSFWIGPRQCTWSQLARTTAIIPHLTIDSQCVRYICNFLRRSLVRQLCIRLYAATSIIQRFYASTIYIYAMRFATFTFTFLQKYWCDSIDTRLITKIFVQFYKLFIHLIFSWT